jgi:hypothetical protein
MREKQQKQMPLMEPASSHPQEKELEAISTIIDNTPTIILLPFVDTFCKTLTREDFSNAAQGLAA